MSHCATDFSNALLEEFTKDIEACQIAWESTPAWRFRLRRNRYQEFLNAMWVARTVEHHLGELESGLST